MALNIKDKSIKTKVILKKTYDARHKEQGSGRGARWKNCAKAQLSSRQLKPHFATIYAKALVGKERYVGKELLDKLNIGRKELSSNL